MTTIKKASDKKSCAIVSSRVKSYANDPYFVKKAEDAKEILSKVGLPGSKKK